MSVAFVFTNPRHHLEMMTPVAIELVRAGVACELVSMAELRGLETPRDRPDVLRVVPINLRRRRNRSRGASKPPDSEPRADWRRGSLAKQIVWRFALAPRLRRMLRRARLVVIPNDAVYPYVDLVAQLRRRGVPTVLMQEGIRFELPGYDGPQYGSNASMVCAWGEGSRDYFIASNVPRDTIAVTGAPRLDDLDLDRWRGEGKLLVAKVGLSDAPLAFLSNPIEIQGYGSRELKLELFARWLSAAAPILRARRIPVIVKNHLYEDPADYARVANQSSIADLVTVVHDAPIFAAIAAARAAVVLTSTVGLEVLMFGIPLGVLEVPGFGFAFDYVQRGAATALHLDRLREGITELLADDAGARATAARAFVEHHLCDRGRARYHVAAVIQRELARQA